VRRLRNTLLRRSKHQDLLVFVIVQYAVKRTSKGKVLALWFSAVLIPDMRGVILSAPTLVNLNYRHHHHGWHSSVMAAADGVEIKLCQGLPCLVGGVGVQGARHPRLWRR
jgi:hypothetical protein